ncbi:MAG: ATP-binding protein, partial [Deltaproteobacteria bacterium]
MLGDIEFEPWQCIAELIDNAFVDFLEVHRSGTHWPDGFKVSVSLPDGASADATIVIEDSGRGM